jgi:hypothetical protein
MKKDYSITVFYCFKSLVLLSAAVYATVTGLDNSLFVTTGLMSLAAIPLFAYFEQ